MPDDTSDTHERDLEDDNDTSLVVACAVALVAIGIWVLVLWLPYITLPGQSFSLVGDDGSVRTSRLAPRVVGMVLVAIAATTTLLLRRRRGPWWTTAGALLGLTAFAAYWWTSTLDTGTSGRDLHGPAWYLDGLACVVALGATALGARAARTDRGLRPYSAPSAAIASGLVAVVVLALTTRNPAFLPALATSSGGTWGHAPAVVRAVGVLTAIVIVVVPVAAPLSRLREATLGLALGWLALLAPLVAWVVAVHEVVPGGVGGPFVAGCLLAGLLVAALIVWAQLARRPDPTEPRRSRAERRQRDDSTPLQM